MNSEDIKPGIYRRDGCWCGRYHIVSVEKSYGSLRYVVSPKSHMKALDGQPAWLHWREMTPHDARPKQPPASDKPPIGRT